MGFGIPKISLGSAASKKYTHNLSFDNNTTADFGTIQPLLSQRMEPGSSISVSGKQLVRLMPMPVPSFARVHLQNECTFVPIGDVVPYYDAMLALQPYTSNYKIYKPVELPYTDNAALCYLLLCKMQNTFTIYTAKTLSGQFHIDSTPTTQKNVYDLIFEFILHSSPSNISILHDTDEPIYQKVSLEGADYVVCGTKGDYDYCIAVRVSPAARRLRKVLIGLGYGLNASDTTHVSIAPLLAFYKSYFDLYQSKRESYWLTSRCYELIKDIENYYRVDFTLLGLRSTSDLDYTAVNNSFIKFLTVDLANLWYVSPDDFLSIHRAKTATPAAVTGRSYVFASGSTQGSISTEDSGDGTTQPVLEDSPHDLITLQMLQRLTRFVNKDSIIGTKISDYVRNHYGSDVSNQLYHDAYHIGSSRLDCEINDVFSTSDTYNGSDGSVLGEFAGKGIGFSKMNFKFKADKMGFFFIMSSMVPQSGYFQGNDLTLYALNPDTIPNPDFDAVGFEVTPYAGVASCNDIVSPFDKFDFIRQSMGFVPRYSGFKVKRNIVNGDMSRRGTFDSMSPYYLDRVLTTNFLESSVQADDSVNVHLSHNSLPLASQSYRELCRYKWLGDFNRLFSMPGSIYLDGWSDDIDAPDNFIIQTLFDVRVTNFLKPLSQSFDTFEESNDKTSHDVSAD